MKRGKDFLILGFFSLGLLACSVPNFVNPVSWVDTSWFEKKFMKKEKVAENEGAKKGSSYPKLSSVPDRPNKISIKEMRKELTSGLVADTNNARYTDELIRLEQPASLRVTDLTEKLPSPSVPQPIVSNESPPTLLSLSESLGKESTAKLGTVLSTQDKVETKPIPAMSSQPSGSAKHDKPHLLPRIPEVALKQAAPLKQQEQTTPFVQVATIYFGYGKAALKNNDLLVLQEVAKICVESEGTIKLVGHSSRGKSSDTVKRRLFNLKLSLDRANTVAEVLVGLGVIRDRMQIIARGDAELLYEETTAAGLAGNRRVEIFLVDVNG